LAGRSAVPPTGKTNAPVSSTETTPEELFNDGVNILRHSFVGVPKLYVSEASGTRSEVKSATTVTVSTSLSPKVRLPPIVRLPVISALASIVNVVPSKANLLLSTNSPSVPAYIILPDVKSVTLTEPNSVCPGTRSISKNTPPAAVNDTPSKYRLAESTNSPSVPAYTILVGVKSSTFNEPTSA